MNPISENTGCFLRDNIFKNDFELIQQFLINWKMTRPFQENEPLTDPASKE